MPVSARAARVKGSAGGGSAPESGKRGRGVTLDSLEAVLRASASPREWGRFVKATGMSAIPGAGKSGTKVDYSAYFYALPTGTTAEVDPLYLYGDLRPVPGEETSAQLKLRWEMMPEGSIPQRIKGSSRAVGGWPKVLHRIATGWPGGEAASVDVTATFVIDEGAYRPLPALRLKSRPSIAGSHRLTQTAVAWSVDPPSGPVARLSVALLRATELVLVASGRHALTLGPDMASELEGAVWEGARRFLKAT
ncbi:hypothetical protein WME73_26155 [Sorangium sp. So ce302]|uniref:hypothetical protein n=1 Tax=unclassified Sorangium TaxID=2621164 RepID=UPI003F62BF2D